MPTFLKSRNADILIYMRKRNPDPGKKAALGKCREENDLHDTLHTHSVRSVFHERERHDVTTT
jgi:hypothetical protein